MPRFGEKNHNAKLSDEKVREMRAMYQRWQSEPINKGYRTLGRIFKCSEWTARDIVTYRTRISA